LFPKGVVTENSVEEIRQDYNGSNHIIFSLDLLPASIFFNRGIMLGNIPLEHYLKGEDIIGFSYKVETIPQGINVSKMTLTLILPNNSIVSYNFTVKKNIVNIYRLSKAVKLSDSGLLQIEIRFNVPKSCIVWRNISSNKHTYYITYQPKGNTTGTGIPFSNIYRQAIPILTPSEAIMINEKMLSEKEIKIIQKGYFITAISTIMAAIIGAIGAIIGVVTGSWIQKRKTKNNNKNP